MGSIEDFKYKKVEKILDKNLINFFQKYCTFRHQFDNKMPLFDDDNITAGDSQHYGDLATESLLLMLQPKIEEITNKKLLPTYSFWRMYTYGSYLKKHLDREACEISVTLNIMSDTDWPIYIEENEVNLKPGDGVIYLGCELTHERKKLIGDYQAQIFLHYVEKNGKNARYKFDERPTLGAPK
jgi:hypothetical protein